MPCPEHPSIPFFGCKTCIKADRKKWETETFDKWAKTYKPKKCPSCGLGMVIYGYSTGPNGLVGEIVCPNVDDDQGYFPCADEDYEVAIS